MDYVIITGASIENLGAESMTCIAIEMAKKMHPNCEVVISTSDKIGMQSKIYFKTCSYVFPTYMNCHQISMIGRFLSSKIDILDDHFLETILPMTKAIIDISGYAFSTKWGGTGALYYYLNKLFIARAYKIPYYIMPQSFGPFDYKNKKEKICSEFLMRLLFKEAKCVYARELVGMKALQKAGVKNVTLCPDMVLLYKEEIDYTCFRKFPKKLDVKVKYYEKNVAIVPNQKVIEKTANNNEYILVLDAIASMLKREGYNVYFIAHCKLDCELIHHLSEVVNYMDCTEAGAQSFDGLVSKFDFIISSRYHAVVHAYRNDVPAISLGWEDKYKYLMELLSQEKYCYECHKKIIEVNDVLDMINSMMKSLDHKKKIIKNKLGKLRDENEYMELYCKE